MSNNVSGNAYSLTVLSPIKEGWTADGIAYADAVRERLQEWNTEVNSPMAQVPDTYLCRFFVLDDVYHQSLPGAGAFDTLSDWLPVVPNSIRRGVLPFEDHLKSRYLAFSCSLYGGPSADIDSYLIGMWDAIQKRIREVWGWCYGFEAVADASSFAAYIRKCQLTAALFFVGSNDDSLAEQLKALYLKQEFARFAVANQGLDTVTLRRRMQAFLKRVQPANLAAPTWAAGRYDI